MLSEKQLLSMANSIAIVINANLELIPEGQVFTKTKEKILIFLDSAWALCVKELSDKYNYTEDEICALLTVPNF